VNGPVEILELVLAEVAERDSGDLLLLVREEVLGCLGDEDLSAVRRRRNPRRSVDGDTAVASVDRRRLAGVDTHPHSNIHGLRPVVCCERPLSFHGREDSITGAGEGDEEGVALRVDLVAVPAARTPRARSAGAPRALPGSGRAIA
jgi:hypothetical protein